MMLPEDVDTWTYLDVSQAGVIPAIPALDANSPPPFPYNVANRRRFICMRAIFAGYVSALCANRAKAQQLDIREEVIVALRFALTQVGAQIFLIAVGKERHHGGLRSHFERQLKCAQ